MRITFLGDSLTFRNDWNRALPDHDVVNLGIDGDTTAGVLARVDSAIATRPDCLVLMIGINDLIGWDAWEGDGLARDIAFEERLLATQAEIRAHIARALPECRIIVCSLLPTAFLWEDSDLANEIVRSFNDRLRSAAATEGHVFLDLHGAMADDRGRLARPYNQDGVHLLPAAYALWLERLLPLLPSIR
ncbi:MAG: GDSL-type esterase/lipase family protein [Desulfovibrio sp.]|jgi:N-acetylglucosamine-6-sulfatase|nr:GDSL-type esterase/lipase family protein [Desulfovibrio sp.]